MKTRRFTNVLFLGITGVFLVFSLVSIRARGNNHLGLTTLGVKEMKTATRENTSHDEAQIRARVDEWANAFRSKDIDRVMSVFAPDVVAFDIVAPLAYNGRDSYRKQWEKLFASSQGPIEYEIRDLKVGADHDLAFSHSINRIKGTMKNGQKTEVWLRMTACWKRIDGQWLLEHEHVSVPVDIESQKALLDLKP